MTKMRKWGIILIGIGAVALAIGVVSTLVSILVWLSPFVLVIGLILYAIGKHRDRKESSTD